MRKRKIIEYEENEKKNWKRKKGKMEPLKLKLKKWENCTKKSITTWRKRPERKEKYEKLEKGKYEKKTKKMEKFVKKVKKEWKEKKDKFVRKKYENLKKRMKWKTEKGGKCK